MHAWGHFFVNRENGMWPNGGTIWIAFDRVAGTAEAPIQKLYSERRTY